MQQLVGQFADWKWRLSNLYWITNERGVKVQFRPNPEQLDLMERLWWWNLILKARQIGFTTLIDLMALDHSFFIDDFKSAIIAHGDKEVQEIFESKVRYPWQHLPEQLRDEWNPIITKNKGSILEFKRGGKVYVGTSTRSGTLQLLHVSEFGKICARYPDRADEIISGSFPSVHEGGMVFVESTAEGTGGRFYKMVDECMKADAEKRKRTIRDFKMHFYPWWAKESYRMDSDGVDTPPDLVKYFADLQKKHGIRLDPEQKAWYVVTKRQLKSLMKREHPSHPAEAFEGAMEEKYFSMEMLKLRKDGRLREFPIMASRHVNLSLDLGRDMNAIWFHQYAGLEHRFIDYFEESGRTLDWMVKAIKADEDRMNYLIGNIYLPHDGADKSVMTDNTPRQKMAKLFGIPLDRVRIVPRTPTIGEAINATRNYLAECVFHKTQCEAGVDHLDNYSKDWDKRLGNWKDVPRHDKHSHGASALQQIARFWRRDHEVGDGQALGTFPGMKDRAGVYR
jgi:hypothetical protein